uniref:Endonuclease domain-containing 1 protein-like n=1 Tax=Esox lucius TaxID=8010 RepID=A0A3P9AND9_ESOLU
PRPLCGFLLVTNVMTAARGSVEKELPSECRAFLYMGTPPVGLENHSLQKICQRYNSKARYVTLYDTTNHVPVYSAYVFKRSDGEKRVDVPWMYEPQLSTMSDTGDMQAFPRGYMHRNFEDAQAVLDDYTNAVFYERGHLNPDEHQADPDDKASTYTLTNVVPQVREFSTGVWKVQEHIVRRRLNNYCRGTAYVVTGIVTSGNMIRRHNIDRVAVPKYLWSSISSIQLFIHQVLELSVKKLEEFLQRSPFVDKNFQIFMDDCVQPPSALH